ncbi:NAD(P)-dependent dehydrogenase (short-subunit alcohol dehydrogenase family) [Roseimicrobium gellanilyticum]|uniref:NAD(P)-dependent dehydrogenase (Short-subunit alcohol dehydrogenase family) n=1 Tax=Roseimicrobium gellanilyticum TaxID=748857 RepID=A0A366HR63_9BACT|nr:SDR family NAD(P)-dependent oxidoreductase [Roseimicrobium gellanilyticum]RBP45966.1 NAD(P)-dependent dehydrogenase (short-subunit alcohol dehydrogenase family) [Roseimicrobium gellanilyticum]
MPSNKLQTSVPHDSLRDRVALVTGAGSGIGKAAALMLAEAGAFVGLAGRTESELKQTEAEIREEGGVAECFMADVSSEADISGMMYRLKEKWKRLDIVVANAGINGVWAPIEKIKEKEWEDTVSINLKGTYLTLKHAAPLLKERGGSVIITSSINGTRIFSNLGATAYSCTKAAQVALTKMLSLEWAEHHVRVNVICPGAITTNIDDSAKKRGLEPEKLPDWAGHSTIPLTHGKSGTAEQVASVVWFLASDASSHVTGTEIYVDGGQSLLG